MKVLVAGGTGFIGGACARAIASAGHAVRILAHSPPPPKGGGDDGRSGTESAPVPYTAANQVVPFESRVSPADETGDSPFRGRGGLAGDITDPASLALACAGQEAVVHAVGIITEPRGVTYERVVVQGTRNLLEACLAAGVSRIVFISALGTRADAASRYHRTKWQAEEMIRASGLVYTILRPSVVYGPGGGFFARFLRMPFVPLPRGGRQLYQPIHVDDLAAAVARSLTDPAAENLTLDAGGPETMSFRDMMALVLEAAGRKKPMLPLPMWYMALMAAACDPMQKLFPPLALITRDQYRMLREDNTGDSGALPAVFPGLRLRTLREGLAG